MRGDDPASRFRRPVLWSRGRGCGELASLLGEAGAVRLTGDRMRACIDERAEVLVTRRLPGRFDLVSVVLPVEVDPDAVGIVVAAVAEGPHSTFAACVARRLGAALGVAAEMISAHQEPADRAAAEATLVRIARALPDLPGRTVAAPSMGALVAQLPARALLVFGAPGGSWFQRMIFGRGARLRHAARAGAVIVRNAPPRVFQHIDGASFVAPQRTAADVLLTHLESTLAVVDAGRLVGVVRRRALERAAPDARVAELTEPVRGLRLDEPLDAAARLRPLFGGDPMPVVDRYGRFAGSVRLGGLEAATGPPDPSLLDCQPGR
jgi:CBS domain-containing protein